MTDTPETDYNKMNDLERARFEREHFELLSSTDKFRVASAEFNRGQQMTGERAVIIDQAYGNGDGVLDQEDMKIIEEKRNDMGLLNGMRDVATTMFEHAADSTGNYVLSSAVSAVNGGNGFQLGVGGMLGGLFNSNAGANGPALAAATPQPIQPTGFIQRIGSALGF